MTLNWRFARQTKARTLPAFLSTPMAGAYELYFNRQQSLSIYQGVQPGLRMEYQELDELGAHRLSLL